MYGIKIFSMMLVCSFFFLACEDQGDPVTSSTGPPPEPNNDSVSFASDILPLFTGNTYGCTGCHGGTNNLFLNSYANVMAGNSTRGPVVVPGDTSSLLIRKLKGGTFLGPNDGARMPLGAPVPIAESDLRNMVTWIKEGALDN